MKSFQELIINYENLINKNISARKNLNNFLKNKEQFDSVLKKYNISLNELVYILYFKYADVFCEKNNKRKFINLKKGFANFCQKNCFCLKKQISNSFKSKSLEEKEKIKNKRKETCLNKYGVDNPLKNFKIKEKVKKTNLEKYGVSCILQKDSPFRNSINEFLNLNKNKFSQKRKETVKQKYKTDNISSLKSIKEKKKKTFIKNYNSNHFMKSDKGKEKFINSLKKKYGEHIENPKQIHLSKNTIEILKNKDQFIAFAKNKTISNISSRLGVSKSYIGKKIHEFKCQDDIIYFSTLSSYQEKIVEFLKKNNLNYEINNRKIINPLELDIFIPEKNLAIEICGLYWHSEISGNKNKNYHLNKLEKCLEKNIKLLTIFSDEIDQKNKIVENMIKHRLGLNEKICYARDTEIKEISAEDYRLFTNSYHIQGYIPSKIKLGAFYKNDLVSVMGFGLKRINLGNKTKNEGEFEMLRFCTKGNIPGIGSKLFSYFVINYNPNLIISFSDRRWGEGNFYKNLNFDLVGSTKPSYFYTKDYKTKYNRFSFRKNVILEKYNGNKQLSEWENMKIMGWDRIWDCGTNKWVWVSKNKKIQKK